MQPTGRQFGPYRNVTTIRVEGPFEVCSAEDMYGRPATLVVLSAGAAADPVLRVALGNAAQQSRAAPGPNDTPIADADLQGPQPWVATVNEPGRRGADRLLEQLATTPPVPSGPPVSGSPVSGAPEVPSGPPLSGPPMPAGPPGMPGPPMPVGPAMQPGMQPGMPPGPPPVPPPLWPAQPPGPPPGFGQPGMPSGPPFGPPPSAPGGKGLLISLLSGTAVLVLLLGVVGFLLIRNSDEEPGANPSPSTSASPSEEPEESPSEEPTEEPTEEETGARPALKALAPYIVTGRAWRAGEKTFTVALPGWPFAFRVPDGYTCKRARSPHATDRYYRCLNDDLERAQTAELIVILRPCEEGCAAPDRQRMDVDMPYPPKAPYKVRDATTKWVAESIGVFERLTITHYFGDVPGQPPKWQVIFQGTGAQVWRERIEATGNDIRTQTP